MMFASMNKNKKNGFTQAPTRGAGFTILEIIVVVFIIAMGLVGVLSLIIQNVQVQYVNKNNLIASQLAQEGLELVRNKRDRNFLAGNWFSSGIVLPDDNSKITIYFDGADIIINSVSGIDDNDARLMIDNSFYIYGSGSYSGFNRVVEVENDYNASFTVASCIVQWQEKGQDHQYVVDTILYDWR